MGISRDSWHKHKRTGGRIPQVRKKRKFELGRPSAMTRLGGHRVSVVRSRGGNVKYRALRLDNGNFSWSSEGCTRKCRILNVVYNASNNELGRTNTLVKNAIVQVDSTPFKQWYFQKFDYALGKAGEDHRAAKRGKYSLLRLKARQASRTLDAKLEEQFTSGRLLACISSRPGQVGRVDGYVLEGRELDFYQRKISKKK